MYFTPGAAIRHPPGVLWFDPYISVPSGPSGAAIFGGGEVSRLGQIIDPQRFRSEPAAFNVIDTTWAGIPLNQNQALGQEQCCGPFYRGPDSFQVTGLVDDEEYTPPSNAFEFRDWHVISSGFWIDFNGADMPQITDDGDDFQAVRLLNKNEIIRFSPAEQDEWKSNSLNYPGFWYRSPEGSRVFALSRRWNWNPETKVATVEWAKTSDTSTILFTWSFAFSTAQTPEELDNHIATSGGFRAAFSRRKMPAHRRHLRPAGESGQINHITPGAFSPEPLTGTWQVSTNMSGGYRILLTGTWRHFGALGVPAQSFGGPPDWDAPRHSLKWSIEDYRTALSSGTIGYGSSFFTVTNDMWLTYSLSGRTMVCTTGKRNSSDTGWIWRGTYEAETQWSDWSFGAAGAFSGSKTLSLVDTLDGTPPASISCEGESVAPSEADQIPPPPVTHTALGFLNVAGVFRYWPVQARLEAVAQPGTRSNLVVSGDWPKHFVAPSVNEVLLSRDDNDTFGGTGLSRLWAGWLAIRKYIDKPFNWEDDPEEPGYIGPWRPERFENIILRARALVRFFQEGDGKPDRLEIAIWCADSASPLIRPIFFHGILPWSPGDQEAEMVFDNESYSPGESIGLAGFVSPATWVGNGGQIQLTPFNPHSGT